MPVLLHRRTLLNKWVVISTIALGCWLAMLAMAAEPASQAPPRAEVEAPALPEARVRARLLHETVHGALQVMHRDFFRDGKQRMPIPSESFEEVFAELDRKWNVKLSWLAVNAPPMNEDHRAKTPFDERAVQAITGGAEQFDEAVDGSYSFAGQIDLGNQCLKCHVPNRTSLEARKAAVVISMPVARDRE